MKNKSLTIKIGVSIFATLLFVLLVLIFKNSVVLNKSYAYDAEGITGIAQFVDEGNETISSASFILQDLDSKTLELQENNKYKVFCNDENITISLLDTKTNDPISSQNGIFTMPKDGVTVKVDGIDKNNKYDVVIKPLQSNKGYKPNYSEATIELDYTDVLSASVKEIKDWDNQPITLSDDDRILFLYTDLNDKIKLRANKDVDIEYTFSTTQLSDEELNNATFAEYDKDNYLQVQTNGYLYAKAKYKTSAYSKVSMLRINNIDRLGPVISEPSIALNGNHSEATVTYSFDDHEATDEDGKSGVLKYAFSDSNQLTDSDDAWVTASAGEYSSTVDDNGEYYIHVKDVAGNVTTKKVTVIGIDIIQEGYYVLILDSSNPNLIGRYYNSLKEMKDELVLLNLTNEDTVVAQIEGDIQNQRLDVENVNLTIDLNGYTLQSKNTNPTFNIKSGANLKIVDNKYTISDYLESNQIDTVISGFETGSGYGKVVNTKTDAIVINEGGTLQLGEDNSPDLAHIEYPDHSAPYIQGLRKGVYNKGTFNYYDGVLYGGIAIDGGITDTPSIYSPSVVEDTETGDFRVTLDKVTNIEALIGKTRYTLLEDAIEAANNRIGDSNTQVKIDIVTNIIKADTVYVPDSKNIILDLNGNTMENTSTNAIISNYGKLVIQDSGDSTGFKCSQIDCVLNNSHGELTLNSGKYTNTVGSYNSILKRYQSLITNAGKLTVNGGNYSMGGTGIIFYNTGGNATFNGGTFNESNIIKNSDYYDEKTVLYERALDLSKFKQNADYANYNGTFSYEDGKLNANTNRYDNYVFTALPIDLTMYTSFDTFELEFDTYTMLEENAYLYAHIAENDTYRPPADTTNRAFLLNGTSGYNTSTYRIKGGKYYYLVLGYYDNNRESYPNEARFNEIKLRQFKTINGNVHVVSGNYSGGDINSESLNGSIVIDNGTFKTITNNKDTLTINDGTFSGGISADEVAYINGGTFNGAVSIKGKSLNITNGTFNSGVGNSGTYTSTINVTGGTFNGNISSMGTLSLKNANIQGYISFNSSKTMLIDNCTIIYNEINKGLRILSREYPYNFIDGVEYPVIRVKGNGNAAITNTTITSNVRIQDFWKTGHLTIIGKEGTGDLTISDTTITSTIEDYGTEYWKENWNHNTMFSNVAMVEGNLYIDRSTISLINPHPWSESELRNVYNRGTGNIYLGTKDGTYNADQLTLYSDVIAFDNKKSNTYYYDGLIKQKAEEYNDSITEFEEDHTLDKYTEDGVYVVSQKGVPSENIYNVNKEKYYRYLNAAIQAASSGDKLRLDAEELFDVSTDVYTIAEGKNLTFDLNGNTIYLGNNIIVNGNLSVIDESDSTGSIYAKGIINNNTLNISAGNWNFATSSDIGILNNGNCTFSNSSVTTSDLNNFEVIMYNNGTLTTNNLNIDLDDNYISAYYNTETGKSYINNNTITGVDNTTSTITNTTAAGNYGHVLTNTSGYVELNDSTIKASTNGFYKLIYNDGTIKDIYNFIVNNSTNQITLTDGDITIKNAGAGYFPIDLSSYSGDLEIEMIYYMYQNAAATNPIALYFSESTDKITGKPVDGSFARVTEAGSRVKYTGHVTGGKHYYFHMYGTSSRTLRIYELNIKQNGETIPLLVKGRVVIDGGSVQLKGTAIEALKSYVDVSNYLLKDNDDRNDNVAITSMANSFITLDNVTVSSRRPAVSVNSNSKLTANNLTIHSTMTKENAFIASDLNSYWNAIGGQNSELEFTNLNANRGIQLTNSNALIKSGTITSTKYGISATGSNLTMGEVSDNLESPKVSLQAESSALEIHSGSHVTLINSDVKATDSNSTAISLPDNDTSLIITNEADYNSNVSTTRPVISGGAYGINNANGNVGFYDGVIKGSTALVGGISSRPDEYELNTEKIDGVQHMTLLKYDVIKNIDKGKTYSSLSSAFNDCTDNEVCNLQLLMTLSLAKSQTVPANKIVNLDLNNNVIHSVADNNIYNYGNLTITNGKIDIMSTTNFESAIHNYGTLTTTSNVQLKTNAYTQSVLIKNHVGGNLYVNGSTVDGMYNTTNDCGTGKVIVNEGGYAVIDGGTYSLKGKKDDSYGIHQSCVGGTITSSKSIPEYVQTKGTNVGGSSGKIKIPYNSAAYVVLDLTNYSGNVDLAINYTAVYNNTAGTAIHLTTSNELPTYSTTTDRLVLLTNNSSSSKTLSTIRNTTVAGGQVYYLHVQTSSYSSGYLIINDISLTNNGTEEDLFKPAHTIIKNATIDYTGDGSAISNYESTLEINNVTMTGHPQQYVDLPRGISNYGNSTLTVDGLTTRDFGDDIRNLDSSNSTLKNVTTSYDSTNVLITNRSDYVVYSTGGKIILAGGDLTAGTASVYLDGSTELAVDDSTLTSKSGITLAKGTSTVNIGMNSLYTDPVVINASENGISITGDNTINIGNANITSNKYGINQAAKSRSTITLSDGKSAVSQTTPTITGNQYAIYNSGILNYYDGKLVSPVVLEGAIASKPDDYEVVYTTTNGVTTAVLDNVDVAYNQNTNTNYKSLITAVNACSDDVECTVKLLHDVNLTQQLVVGESKNMILDLQEHNINVTQSDVIHNILNRGTLTIQNGSISGPAIEDLNGLIDNNGKLTTIDLTMNQGNSLHSRLILNRGFGELNIKSGTYNAMATQPDKNKPRYGSIVYNEGGFVVIDGGVFNSNSRSYSSSSYGASYAIYTTSRYPTTDINSLSTSNSYYLATLSLNKGKFIEIDTTSMSGNVDIEFTYASNSNVVDLWLQEDKDTTYVPSDSEKTNIPRSSNSGSVTMSVVGGKKYYLTSSNYIYIRSFKVISNTETIDYLGRGQVVINDMTSVETGVDTVIYSNNSDIEVNGGTFTNNTETSQKGTFATINNETNLTLNGGTIKWKSYGFNVSNSSNLTINDCTMESVTYGVSVATAALTMNGGNINATTYGITASNGTTVDIYGGSINSDKYGLGISSPSMTLTLGKNDGAISVTSPHITGTEYGLFFASASYRPTVNFYDGIFTTPGQLTNGEITEVPQDYQVVNSGDDYYIGIESSIENTYKYDGMYFQSINMPINMISELDNKVGTIELGNDVVLSSQVVIPEGVNITLALHGHSIQFADGIDKGIVNNGTLTITDGTGDDIDENTMSWVINANGVVVQNNGTLTIGASGNQNSNSPHIKGKTAITGNNATLLSGKIESTDGGIIQTVGAFLTNLFTFNIEPSYSYKTSQYKVSKLSDDTILATSPTFRSVQSLEQWTNSGIDVGMTSHNLGLLNLVTDRDPNETKDLIYSIEVYKNGELDEFYSFKKELTVQYLETDYLDVDLNWFDDVQTKFKGYYLTRMSVDGVDTTTIPEAVKSGTVIRLYYGQVQGDEIELINPKTGRKSYKKLFGIALIAFVISIIAGVLVYKGSKKNSVYNI